MEMPAIMGLGQLGAGSADMAFGAVRDMFNQGVRAGTAALTIPQIGNQQTAMIQRADEATTEMQRISNEQNANRNNTYQQWLAQQPGRNGNASYVDTANAANRDIADAFTRSSADFRGQLQKQEGQATDDYNNILGQRGEAKAEFEKDSAGVLNSLEDTRASDLRSVGAQVQADYQGQLASLDEARASGEMSEAAYVAAKGRLDQQAATTRGDQARTAMDMYSRRVADTRLQLTNSRQSMLSAWGDKALGAQGNRQQVQDAVSRGYAHLMDTEVGITTSAGNRVEQATRDQQVLDTAASKWSQANDDDWAQWQRGNQTYKDSLAAQIDAFTFDGLKYAATLMSGMQMQQTGPGFSEVVGNAVNAYSAGKAWDTPDAPSGDFGLPGAAGGAGVGALLAAPTGGLSVGAGALIGGGVGYAGGSMIPRR